AAAAQQYQSGGTVVENKLVELLIRNEQNALINVIQDYDPAMVFANGDKVRILYFDDGVRVDKTY
ncbi:MAG: glycine zipper 2TM domain-containing protein, partial [Aeromonas allosaccharophila]